MCCGKSKNNGVGAVSPSLLMVNDNPDNARSFLEKGTISNNSVYLIYQFYPQATFRGFDGRQYRVKGLGTCLKVDEKDAKHLLGLKKRARQPYFLLDSKGTCAEVKVEEKEIPIVKGSYELASEAVVLTEEEKIANPLEGETLQEDMYPEDKELIFGENEMLIVGQDEIVLSEEVEIDPTPTIAEKVIPKTRRKRTNTNA